MPLGACEPISRLYRISQFTNVTDNWIQRILEVIWVERQILAEALQFCELTLGRKKPYIHLL